jgi:two-component system, NarL family, nitrate/nitrite response regulator NarL
MDPEFHFLIVAVDPLVRAGLAASIEDIPGCQVVGLANPAELLPDLAAAIEEVEATIVLWDWGLDAGDSASVDFQETDIPIIALLADSLQTNEVWTSGARALIRRDASGEAIYTAATAVFQGFFVIDPEFTLNILPKKVNQADDLEEQPTVREQQVLQLMAEGLTNKAIAQQLGISQHTAKFHVNSILGKLNAQSRTEAVVQATRLGLIAL